MLTEDEKKQFLKNEEKLWDMAALTSISTLYLAYRDEYLGHSYSDCAIKAYDLADALILERRKRLAEPLKAPPMGTN